MKKLFLFASLIMLASTVTFAQSNKEEVEMMQSIFGMEKKAIVAEFIKLEGEAATSFWALYDEYETERKAIGQKRVKLLTDYAEKYADLDDETTDALVAENIKIINAQNKLIQKYYKSIKKASGSKAAAQFLQLEYYFVSVVRMSIMEEIPFIGEFDN